MNSSKATSYTAMLFKLLADYEPMNKESYRSLQKQIQTGGDDNTQAVGDWLDCECSAIQADWIEFENSELCAEEIDVKFSAVRSPVAPVKKLSKETTDFLSKKV